MLLFLSKATLLFHHTVTMIFLANNQLKTRASTMLEIFKITIKLKSFIKNNCR